MIGQENVTLFKRFCKRIFNVNFELDVSFIHISFSVTVKDIDFLEALEYYFLYITFFRNFSNHLGKLLSFNFEWQPCVNCLFHGRHGKYF